MPKAAKVFNDHVGLAEYAIATISIRGIATIQAYPLHQIPTEPIDKGMRRKMPKAKTRPFELAHAAASVGRTRHQTRTARIPIANMEMSFET